MSYPTCPNCGEELSEALYTQTVKLPVYDDGTIEMDDLDGTEVIDDDQKCPSCECSVSRLIEIA